MLRYLSGYKRESVLAPLFKMLEATFDLFVPLVMADIVNVGIAAHDFHYILVRCGILLLLAFVGLVCSLTAQYFSAKAAVGYSTGLRHALFEHIQTLSFSEMDTMGTSTLITRMTSDVNQVQSGLNLFLRLFLRSPFVVFGAMVMAFTVNFRAALIFVVAIAFLLAVLASIMVPTFKIFDRVFKNYDNLNSSVQENVSAIRVVKSFVREGFENEKYTKACEGLYQQFVNAESRLSFNNPAMLTAIYGCNIALSWFGAKYVLHGAITTGQLNALFGYIMNILMALMMLSMAFVMISMSAASAKRIVEVLDEKTDLPPAKAPVQEVKDGKFEALIESLMEKPLDAIKELYNHREIEK